MKDLFDEKDSLGEGVSQRTPSDDKPAMSVDDKAFLDIIDREVFMDDSNSWVAPLPFIEPRPKLPKNRVQRHTLGKKANMKEQWMPSCRGSLKHVMLNQPHFSVGNKSVGSYQSLDFIIHVNPVRYE